jgi:outer membrane protein OmpA-like peptidoglycan-associated protein
MRRLIMMMVLSSTLTAVPAWAQGDSDSGTRTERPATASYWGDTGLWFIPTAETVKPGGWSFSLYRTEFDFKQGFSDVSDWPLTVAVGAGPRTEIFGALRVVTRIDRDLRPLFTPGSVEEGGLINDRPFVNETWTGNDLGDLFVGGKFNVLTEHRQQPFAMALRGTMKMPTADQESGAGTGEWDYFADAVVSKELNQRVEVSGFGGYAWRGDPSGISLSDGFRWGLGAAFGARSNLRLTTEVFGELASNEAVITAPGFVTGTDGSLSPVLSDVDTGVTTAFGLTWQHRSGVSLGAGVTYQFGLDESEIPGDNDTGRAWGMQFRIGFHNGVRMYVPPAPPRIAEAAPAAPAPAAPAPAPPAKPAPPPPPPAAAAAPKPEPAPAVAKALTLEEVHFDFDMDALRPDAIAVLDRMVDGLKQNPGTRVRIEGHASFEGTSEYNLTLGERRAQRVRQYLESRGIATSTLSTLSKGEESPKYDNSKEEGRALNRRAEFIIDK